LSTSAALRKAFGTQQFTAPDVAGNVSTAATVPYSSASRTCRSARPSANEDSGYVVTDELGRPVHPEWFSDEFHRVRERAGLSRIRLHDGRHTSNSLMAAAGVPAHIRAA
jgi:integrase